MKQTGMIVCAALLLGLIAGCGTTARRIDTGGKDALTTVYNVDPADWNMVAEKSMNSLLTSGALKRNGKKPVIMISRIRNYTCLHLERGILIGKMRQAILASGLAQVTSAVGYGSNLDLAVRRIRLKELDDLFAAGTIPARGTVIAPDMSLSGSIIQQSAKSGRTEENYFLFHIVLTDLQSGIAVWECNTEFSKQSTKSLL